MGKLRLSASFPSLRTAKRPFCPVLSSSRRAMKVFSDGMEGEMPRPRSTADREDSFRSAFDLFSDDSASKAVDAPRTPTPFELRIVHPERMPVREKSIADDFPSKADHDVRLGVGKAVIG
jgi:hypothetical protein